MRIDERQQKFENKLSLLYKTYQHLMERGFVRNIDWDADVNICGRPIKNHYFKIVSNQPLDFMIKAAIVHDAKPYKVVFMTYEEAKASYASS